MQSHTTESGLVWIQDGSKKLGVILGKLAAEKRWTAPLWQASYTTGDDRCYISRARTSERALEDLEILLRRNGAMRSFSSMLFAKSA